MMEGYIGRVVFLLCLFFYSSHNHECFLGADIAVVFDFDPSTTDMQVEYVWSFFDNFISIIEEDPDTRVAFLSYSSEVRARAFLSDLFQPQELRQLRDFYSSITDFTETTHHGLLLLGATIFNAEAGDRPDKPNVALILSNRPTSDFDVMSDRAKTLKSSGVTIYIICIGDTIPTAESDVLASSDNHTIKVDFFEDLPEYGLAELKGKAFDCMSVVFVVRQGGLENVYNSWASDVTINENNIDAWNISSSFLGLYKSHNVQEWDNLEISQVRVALYTKGLRKSFFIFNGTGSDKFNWFRPDRLIITSELGVVGATTNFYSVVGDAENSRRFFINSRYQGCTGDYGWLVVVDTGDVTCDWSEKAIRPYFLYSPSGSAINWRFAPMADVFVVSIRLPPKHDHPVATNAPS